MLTGRGNSTDRQWALNPETYLQEHQVISHEGKQMIYHLCVRMLAFSPGGTRETFLRGGGWGELSTAQQKWCLWKKSRASILSNSRYYIYKE